MTAEPWGEGPPPGAVGGGGCGDTPECPPCSDSAEATPQDNTAELSVPIRYEANLFLSRWGWEKVGHSGGGWGVTEGGHSDGCDTPRVPPQ